MKALNGRVGAKVEAVLRELGDCESVASCFGQARAESRAEILPDQSFNFSKSTSGMKTFFGLLQARLLLLKKM